MNLPAAFLVLLLPATVAAQTPPRAAVIAAATDIIQKARYCTFITLGEDGQPQARIVDPIAPDADFTIWFATNPLTRKVDQVRRNPKVTLSCFDAETSSYVTLLGRGSLVSDAAEKQRHWKNDWAAIYPKGARSDDLMLIRIAPVRLEIVSEARGMIGDAQTWLPLSIGFIEQLELQAIETAKRVSARELDRSLPAQPFAAWLEEIAGADAPKTWESNDCGEQPGHPAPPRDYPICAVVDVTLPGARHLVIFVHVGTLDTGANASPPLIRSIDIVEPNRPTRPLQKLSELSGAIGRVR
jgi:general stress protein 26